MNIQKFHSQKDFHHFLENDPEVQKHLQFEAAIMSRRRYEQTFWLEGYCQVCDKPATFLVDQLYGAQETPQGWLPNWRERLVCKHCQLTNRQRAILHVLKEAVATHLVGEQPLSLYAMEQLSPLFKWLSQHLPNVICLGSEYFGEPINSGTIVNGLRHENVENWSFTDQSFDFIISNDVLEHVNLPERAIAEMYRTLKSQGQFFITIPFCLNAVHTVRRAEVVAGVVKHLLPPNYHGNPLSSKGSLVFHDFGWEWVEQLKQAGFQEVSLCSYWSYLYGYLGAPQYYFWARKP